VLQQAQSHVLNLRNWHQFLSALIGAGFRGEQMISSQNALLYAYAFYLIGRVNFKVPEHELQKVIGRWFLAIGLTGRYANSPESTMDGDLNRLRGVSSADEFIGMLDDVLSNELTNDFWSITLPAKLATSSARNPELFAYIAAQNRLNAPVLFSHKKVSELIDPALQTKKKPLERHHLFPRAWLENNLTEDRTQINQVANYALLEWPENIDIGGKEPPSVYLQKIRARFDSDAWKQMAELHALPDSWEQLPYTEFLARRRELMAAIIRRGFETLR
jgi:hypothetical protein